MTDDNIDIVFGPSGTKFLFNTGVAYYLLKYFPLRRNKLRVYTISGGFMGMVLMYAHDHHQILEIAQRAAEHGSKVSEHLDSYNYVAEQCRKTLEDILPDNIAEILGDRLSIGCSTLTLPPLRKVVSGPFANKQDVIDAALASAYIPVLMKKDGTYGKSDNLIDGGFSHRLPQIATDTLCITPNENTDVDVYIPTYNGLNLNYANKDIYMKDFWLGVEMAQLQHVVIERKLKSRGLIPKIGYLPSKTFSG